MRPPRFHVLSFEGPDPYSAAGGLASRIHGLARELVSIGADTHLWFVGDPDRPGREDADGLALHRWCQWISRYHPGGVYDGEDGKVEDYARSLPPYLLATEILPAVEAGEEAVVLAEEWHTVPAVLHLDRLLREQGCRRRVRILWNANNVFGFDRIDWQGLRRAATITTVSRYMKHVMWRWGVDAIAISNGIPPEAFRVPEGRSVAALRRPSRSRLLLAKVARWDPDKHWILAMETVAELKREGMKPLLVARGGVEAHGEEVLRAAATFGLRIVERPSSVPGAPGLAASLEGTKAADVVVLRSHLDPEARALLFRASDVVLANSRHEPFGLIGLEAMAVGGLACTGGTGEDYAEPGRNALVLQTSNPRELLGLYRPLREDPVLRTRIRREAQATARRYSWEEVVARQLLPRLGLASAA